MFSLAIFSCSDLMDTAYTWKYFYNGHETRGNCPMNYQLPSHIHGQPLLSTTFNAIFMVDYLNILNINVILNI